jgi:hypothetical protein
MFNPLYMSESKITIGGTAFEAEISSVKLTPTTPSATFKGLKRGSSFTKSGLASWVAGLNFGQDHEAATSLSNYLFDHEGEELPYTIEPIDGGTGFAGTLIAQAGEIGGDVDAFGTASVTLPVQGKPTRTFAGA